MKRLFALLLVLALLVGCAGEGSTEPVWQTGLAGGGSFAVSGCTVSEGGADYTAQQSEPVRLPLLYLDGIPTLTFAGVAETDILLQYAEPQEDAYIYYLDKIPEEKIDYRLTREEDGTLHYRLDTVYSYCLTVGEEQWLLVCSRDI